MFSLSFKLYCHSLLKVWACYWLWILLLLWRRLDSWEYWFTCRPDQYLDSNYNDGPFYPDRQHDHCPSLGPRNLTFFLWLLLMVLAPLMQFLLLDVCKCYLSDPFQCNWIFFAFLSIMQVTSQTLRGPLGQYQMVSSSPRIDLLFKHLIFNSFLDFFSLVFWGS